MTPLSHCVNIDSTTRKRRSVANPSPCPGHCPVGTTGHDKPHHGMHQVNECKNDTSGHGGAMSGCPVLAPPTTAMASWSLTSGSANAALHSIMGAPVAARSSLIMSVVTFTLMGRASRLHTGVAPAGVADRAPWHKPKDMERIMLWEWRGEQRCEIENCGCIALPCTLREGRVVGMQEGTGRAEKVGGGGGGSLLPSAGWLLRGWLPARPLLRVLLQPSLTLLTLLGHLSEARAGLAPGGKEGSVTAAA